MSLRRTTWRSAVLAAVTVVTMGLALPSPPLEDSFDRISEAAAAARTAGRLEEAIEGYRLSIRLRPDWQEGWWNLGTLLYERDRYHEARDAFQRLVELAPDVGASWAFLGLCRFQVGEYPEALSDLVKARGVGLRAGTAQLAYVARYHTALLLGYVGRFEDAYEVLRFMVYERIRNEDIIEALGLCTLRMPLLPQQVPSGQHKLLREVGRAVYEFASDNFDLADNLFGDVVRRHSETPNVHYAYGTFLAKMMVRQGRERALEQYRLELEVSPDHVPALLQLAYDLIKQGDFQDARLYAERALKIDSDHFAAHHMMGRIELEVGEVSAAIESLERARQLEPASPETRFSLAKAYRKAGREGDAARERAEFTRLSKLKEETIRKLH